MSRLLFVIAAATLPVTAWAHPGHPGGGFMSGFAHPFSGLDHVLTMLAVGIWAARSSGMGRWFVPVSFLAGMLAGGLLGFDGFVPAFLESAVAASVLASALLVALSIQLPMPLKAGLALFFALWHGIAHGAELSDAPWGHACGFLAATALLLGCGLALGHRFRGRDRWLGGGMAALALSLF